MLWAKTRVESGRTNGIACGLFFSFKLVGYGITPSCFFGGPLGLERALLGSPTPPFLS